MFYIVVVAEAFSFATAIGSRHYELGEAVDARLQDKNFKAFNSSTSRHLKACFHSSGISIQQGCLRTIAVIPKLGMLLEVAS